jgi:hypothetical protein
VIRHVVLRTFRAGADVATIEANTRGFAGIDGIQAVSCGPNVQVSPKDGGFAHITVIDADDVAALRRFFADDRHRRAAELSGPVTERVAILDYELPG